MASLADPSSFIVGVANGCVHILGFLERAASTHERDPVALVLVALLTLLALVAYLRLSIDVFAICVAADGYRHGRVVVERSSNVVPELEQQATAALSPAALLGWLGDLATKLALAVSFLVFGVVLYMIGNVMLAARKS